MQISEEDDYDENSYSDEEYEVSYCSIWLLIVSYTLPFTYAQESLSNLPFLET